MRSSDWSSDLCSSDLLARIACRLQGQAEDHVIEGGIRIVRQVAVGIALDDAEAAGDAGIDAALADQIGRATCRESVCKYRSFWVVALLLKTKMSTIN